MRKYGREKNEIREWDEGIIVPVLKKGKGKKVEDYRGSRLAGKLYKIYAEVLAERVREDIEEKKFWPENQAGFRKRRRTI